MPDEEVDSKPTRQASQNHWKEFLEAGVKIYQYERSMMHGKLLVADGRFFIVGSANLDDRSLFINDEINVHVDSAIFSREQLLMFERDKRHCREITMTNLHSVLEPWYLRFFSGLINHNSSNAAQAISPECLPAKSVGASFCMMARGRLGRRG